MAEVLVITALALVVLVVVAYPLLLGAARFRDAALLEAELARYRTALAAGTVCPRCRFPNPEGSRFCADCGSAI